MMVSKRVRIKTALAKGLVNSISWIFSGVPYENATAIFRDRASLDLNICNYKSFLLEVARFTRCSQIQGNEKLGKVLKCTGPKRVRRFAAADELVRPFSWIQNSEFYTHREGTQVQH